MFRSGIVEKRESVRAKEANQRRVLDDAARRRRQQQALEALEQDNFHDDPHANLVMHKKAPKFEETLEHKRKRKRLKTEPFKQRFKRNFAFLLEEEERHSKKGTPNYVSCGVPRSKYPERHFCSVCGFSSNYTCVQCGIRYCSSSCLGTHRDTRCLKWTA